MAFVQKTFDDLQKIGVYIPERIEVMPRKMLIINESNTSTVCLVIPPPCFLPL